MNFDLYQANNALLIAAQAANGLFFSEEYKTDGKDVELARVREWMAKATESLNAYEATLTAKVTV